MCINAINREGEELSSLDYKLIFWSWHHEESYRLDQEVRLDVGLTDYFKELQDKFDIFLDREQKNWYAKQYQLLGEKMKQEYPSTVHESFLVSSDAYFFSENISTADSDKRLVYNNIHDPVLPVYVSMDVGVNHETVIIFFQLCHGEIRIIDYYADRNKDVGFYANFLLMEKRYNYSVIYLPHDVRKRSEIDVTTSYEREFRKLFDHTEVRIIVLPRMDKQIQIANAKNKFSRCVFNMKKCSGLITHLMKYRKEWSEHFNRYVEKPFDDEHADYADAFCYMARGVTNLEAGNIQKKAMQDHRKAVKNLSRIF